MAATPRQQDMQVLVSRNSMCFRGLFIVGVIGILMFSIWILSKTKDGCSTWMMPGPQQYSYVVIRHNDVDGEDLMHVQAHDMEDVKKVCDLFPNCAGFNSNGWLKSKVSTHVPGPADLYVKSDTPLTQHLPKVPVVGSKVFSSSYEEMNSKMKIYIYEISAETTSSRQYKYDIERVISDQLSRSHLRTRIPDEATFFFIPIRCSYFIRQSSSEQEGILKAKEYVAEIMELIKRTYPYWDRTAGSDHVYICADSIGAGIGGTILKNSIALVYSADYESQNFIPHRDISIPPYPTHQSSFKLESERLKLASSARPVLAFFAGDMSSGRIRPTLYSLFATDHSIVLFSQDISWNVRLKYLSQSKFCLVIRGKDVWSSILIDAVMAGCVPVIISDHYHLPLQGIVNWNDFSVIVPESQVSDLKNRLSTISIIKYKSLQENLLSVQHHFIWSDLARPYDAFYSVMFQLWQRRDVVRYRRK